MDADLYLSDVGNSYLAIDPTTTARWILLRDRAWSGEIPEYVCLSTHCDCDQDDEQGTHHTVDPEELDSGTLAEAARAQCSSKSLFLLDASSGRLWQTVLWTKPR